MRTRQPSLPYRFLRFPFKVLQAAIWWGIVFLSRWRTPEAAVLSLTPIYTRIDPRYTAASLTIEGEWYRLRLETGDSYLLPDLASNHTNLKSGEIARILKNGFGSHPMHMRYFKDPSVVISEGDTVVDIGGYIGTSAITAVRLGAGEVHSIEPSPKTYGALVENVKRIESISPHQIGIWSSNGTMSVTEAGDSSDNRITASDSESDTSVEVLTIDAFAERNRIETIDFLKVDIEGLEKHVIDGMNDVTIRKISMDVGEGDQGDIGLIAAELDRRGYEVDIETNHLYAISRADARAEGVGRSELSDDD